MDKTTILFLIAGCLIGTVLAAPPSSCAAGNYTEHEVGDAIYNITTNGTHLTAMVVFYPKSGKVNWTIANGSLIDANHFMMTFPYKNGWTDHENGTLSPDCTNITWTPNKAVWMRVSHFPEVDTIHVVDLSRLRCHHNISDQLSPHRSLLCVNSSTAHQSLVSLLSTNHPPVLHVRYRERECQPDNVPRAFRWHHPMTGSKVTVVTSPSLTCPMKLSESDRSYVVAHDADGTGSADAMMQAAKSLYPSANLVQTSIADFAQYLHENQESLPVVHEERLPTHC